MKVSEVSKRLGVVSEGHLRRILDPTAACRDRDSRSAYADRRPYVIVDDLWTLEGPTDCVLELPLRLDWSSKRHYDLADDGDRRALYERVLNQALQSEDLQVFLNESLLYELWPRLWLPHQIRDLWEGRFPQLAPSC